MNLLAAYLRPFAIGCGAFAVLFANGSQPSAAVYRVDSGRSTVQIDVAKGGLFKALGHDHVVDAQKLSGTIGFNPGDVSGSSVAFSVDSSSLLVKDPNASEKERQDVQATMESSRVLNTREFPKIKFSSTRMRRLAESGGDLDFQVSGNLNLHGVEKEISFPVRVRFQKDELRATGAVSITQSEFNIVPIKLGGGTVRVKDPVQVKFDIVATKAD